MNTDDKKRRGFGKMTMGGAMRQQRRIEEESKKHYEDLTDEERERYSNEARRSTEQAIKRQEEMKASSDREISKSKGWLKQAIDSLPETHWSDFVDTGRLWMEKLTDLNIEADWADIYDQQTNKDDIERIAQYKYWCDRKQNLERYLSDPNSSPSEEFLQKTVDDLKLANEKIAELDHYFKNEGKNNVAVRNYMFNTDNLDVFDKARLQWEYASRNYENIGDIFENDPWNSWYKAPMTAVTNIIGLGLGNIEGYMKSSRQKLARIASSLDENDPLFQKTYKGSEQNVGNIQNTINSELFGKYDGEKYTSGSYYNDYQREQNKAVAALKEDQQFLKDGKIDKLGFQIDIFDAEDINPQFRKEHEEYGGGDNWLESIGSGIMHPLHGFVETNSTVGMMKYQIPAYLADGASFALAKAVPAFALNGTAYGRVAQGVSMTLQAAAPLLSLKGSVDSRKEETKTEMMGAVTERVLDQVRQQLSPEEFSTVFRQIAQQMDLAGMNTEGLFTKQQVGGQTVYIPKDDKAVENVIKAGIAFNFATDSKEFERAKLDARKGVNKLVNANNALALSDYIQAVPFISFHGSAAKSILARDIQRELQREAGMDMAKKFATNSAEKKILDFIDGGNHGLALAQKKLAAGTTPSVKGIMDHAIDKATKKMLEKDLAKALVTRDVAKYVASKADLMLTENALEGLEEINQYVLSTRYKKGEYDDYSKDVSLFDVNEAVENIGLSINGLGNFFGLRSDFAEDEEQELRKSGIIGFVSATMFGGLSHAKGNIYNASDDNLTSLIKQIAQDKTISKVFAEQQQAVQDLTHLGMYYDAMSKGGRSSQYMIERLQFLKDNIDRENSLVTDGFVDADMKLVTALDFAMNNPKLQDAIEQANKETTSADKDALDGEKVSANELKKRMTIQAAKSIVDANSGEQLLDMFVSNDNSIHNYMIGEVDKLFSYGNVNQEQYEAFKQQNPRLANTIDAILGTYNQYKEFTKNKFNSDRIAAGVETEYDFFEQTRKDLLKKFQDDYNEKLGISESFVKDQDVLRIAMDRSAENKAQDVEDVLRNMYNNDLEEVVFRIANEKKNGLSARDFVVSRLNLHHLYKQLQAARIAEKLAKNNEQIQQRIQEITGLDTDIDTVKGIAKHAQRIAQNLQSKADDMSGVTEIRKLNKKLEKEGKPLIKEPSLESIVGEFQLDEQFDSSDFIMDAAIAEALVHPLRVKRNAYTYGKANPITIRDMVYGDEASTDNESLYNIAKDFQEVSDKLNTEDILGMSRKELKTLESRQKDAYEKAATAFMLQEAKDMKERLYIANKRKQRNTPVTHHDIERAENGDEAAQQRLENYIDEKEKQAVAVEPQQGEQALRVDLEMGKRDTKSNRQKKVEKQKGKLGKNKFSEAAQTAADEAGLIESNEDEEAIVPTEGSSVSQTDNVEQHEDGDVTEETSEKDGAKITKYKQWRKTKSGEIKPISGKRGGLKIDGSLISEDSLEDVKQYDEIRLHELREWDGNFEGTIVVHDKDGWIDFEVKFDGDPRQQEVSSSPSTTEDPLLTTEETQPEEVDEPQDEDGNNEGFEPEPEPQDDRDIVPQDEQKEEPAYVPEVDLTPGEIEQGEVEDRRVSEMDKSTEWIPQDLDSDTGAYSFDDTNRLDGEAAVLDGNGNPASEEDRIAIEQDVEGLLKSEGQNFSQDDITDANSVTTESATNETIGGLINQTVFYDPEATTIPILRINGEDVKLPKPLGTGKELSKKLLKKNWLTKAKKYYIVTQSEVANRMKNVQDRIDTLTVALIIEDDEKCYATFYRALGELYSKKEGETTKIFHKDLTQKLKDELYSKYVDWEKVSRIVSDNDLLSQEEFESFPDSEPSDSQVKAKWVKAVAGVRAKQVAMSMYNGRYGNVTNFEDWWNKSNRIKLSTEDEDVRARMISDAWQIARKQVTKFGKDPIREENIDAQIEELRKNREDVIYAYLNPTTKTVRGKETVVFDFPEQVRTDVKPNMVEQSNGKINNAVDEDTGLHIFHNVAEGLTLPEIARQIESEKLYFGFGTGAFSEHKFDIVEMFKPYGQRDVIKNEQGYSVGKGLSGKIYMIIRSVTGRKVPIQLREQRFDTQIVGGKKVLLKDNNAWDSEAKTDRKFKECFRINDKMMPELDPTVDAKPSIAEVLFYMVCGKLMSGSEKMDAEFFIHNGKRTLIDNTEKAKNANAWFGPKQLYWGAIEQGKAIELDEQDLAELDRSKLGLIIGLPDQDGIYRQTVFMHDELFGPTEEAVQNRRTVIRAIATQMHWSTDALLFQTTSSTGDFGGSFGSIVAEALRQNPGKEECSLFGCPELTFKRSDFEKKDRSGVAAPTQVQYASWCFNTGKLQTDVDLQNPFIAPFVFAKGVKQSSTTKADKDAAKLGVSDTKPASILNTPTTSALTTDEILWKNVKNFDEDVWKRGTRSRQTVLDKIKAANQKEGRRRAILDAINQTQAAQGNPYVDVIAFKFKKDSDSSDIKTHLKQQIKNFISEYNSASDNKIKITLQEKDVDKLVDEIGDARLNNFIVKTHLPVLFIHENGSVDLTFREFKATQFDNPASGITGIYSRVRGKGRVNVQKARTWLENKLGIGPHQIIVTEAIMKGTKDEKVFGLVNLASDSVKYGLAENDPFIMLSTQGGEGIEYHEAWHYVNLLVHNPAMRKQIYKAYAESHKYIRKDGKKIKIDDALIEDIEEALAEEFRNYVLTREATGIRGKILRAYDRIMEFLFYTADKKAYREIFKQIQSGKYSEVSELDPISLKQFHDRYDKYNGARSTEKERPDIYTIDVEDLPGIDSTNDLFETLDGCINAIQYELNFDTIEKVKSYDHERDFKSVIQIIKDLSGKQKDPALSAKLNTMLNNPHLIEKALQDYFLTLDIKFKVKQVKKAVEDNKVPEDQTVETVDLDQSGEDAAVQKEENPDNTWDKVSVATSHKDNAAFRAKMFLRRIPKYRKVYDENGKYEYEYKTDKFGTTEFWSYDEVWNLILNNLWKCNSLDETDESGNYSPKSIRGTVQRLAKSNVMFKALDEKFDDIEDDSNLRSQIFTTISASKNPVMLAMIQNTIKKRMEYYGEDTYDASADENFDSTDTLDNKSEADRERTWKWTNDDSLQVAFSVPRQWSQNITLNGLLKYNKVTGKNAIDKEYAKALKEKYSELKKLLETHKSKKRKSGKLPDIEEVYQALYSINGIRQKAIELCEFLGIPLDNDVLDQYIAQFDRSVDKDEQINVEEQGLQELQNQINVLNSHLFSTINGSIGSIVSLISTAANTKDANSVGNRDFDQIFNNYSTKSDIGKLAVAYNDIHPDLKEYAVRDANGNMMYPINLPTELSDKTQRIQDPNSEESAENMMLSSYCEHSVILGAAEQASVTDPSSELRLNTFAGLKDNNTQNGSDHAGLTALEDFLCKMFLTEQDHIIFPTMADKPTWQSLQSSKIQLSHDLVLCSSFYDDVVDIIERENLSGIEYDEAKGKRKYYSDLYEWYQNLDPQSEVKQEIDRKAFGESSNMYKRFSDVTLRRFALFYLDEINALRDYYKREHITQLVQDENARIENLSGRVVNGRLDFSGNGGKFRYFYDVQTEDGMNLNQKLQFLYKLQKEIEAGHIVDNDDDSVTRKVTIEKLTGVKKKNCDGFELIRQFLDQLHDQVLTDDGQITQDALDKINQKLISVVDTSIENLSAPGDPLQLVSKDSETGLYSPTRIPKQLLSTYLKKMQDVGIVKGASIYSKAKTEKNKYAEQQATYSLLANHIINTILSIMEVEKVYSGDPAQYKYKINKNDPTTTIEVTDYQIGKNRISFETTVDNVYDKFSDKIKRLGGTQSPGNKLRLDWSKEELAEDPELASHHYTKCEVEDIEVPSAHLDVVESTFRTQLLVDYVRNNKIDKFDQYVEEKIAEREKQNEELIKQGKQPKRSLNRERVIDLIYNNETVRQEVTKIVGKEGASFITETLYSQIGPYTNITVTDAQVFIRPALYRKMRKALGEWTELPDETGYSDEIAYKICEEDDTWMSDPEKYKLVKRFQLNALKMSYFQNSPFVNGGMNINKAGYDKMALFPLFKFHRSSAVGRILYDRMNAAGNELDMIAFKSAVKVGAVQSSISPASVEGIKAYVKENYNKDYDKLSKEQKIAYQVEYSGTKAVKEAASKIDERFGGKYEGGVFVPNMPNSSYVVYSDTQNDIKQNLDTSSPHLYTSVQSLRNIRLQLNTKAHDAVDRNIGTQMFKIAFSNIIDDAEYGKGKSGQTSRTGRQIKEDIMKRILQLTNLGIDEIRKRFYGTKTVNGKQVTYIKDHEVQQYIETVCINNGIGEASLNLLRNGATAASLMSRSAFEHGISKLVNEQVVDINTKGGTAIQQSMFGFSSYGASTVATQYGEGLGENDNYITYNDGEELNWNAKEGSMEVLLSLNFFKAVVPKDHQKTPKMMRQWLIDHDIIKGTKTDGTKSNPKPFGIGYRIPTQGMSSMFSYTVADVLPEQCGDLIVVPREFTAQTGSDFDVDKIYLANFSYDKEGNIEKEEASKPLTKGMVANALLQDYIDIISDEKNFSDSRASIDVITKKIQNELLEPVLREKKTGYIPGMMELTPDFQAKTKMEFSAGKSGIGPFALNITNLALTQFAHLTMDFGEAGKIFGLHELDKIYGEDNLRISAWLSAMVNAHVDVAKDPYVFALNVNKFTYNHASLLLRCGKGISTFVFLAQPGLIRYANTANNSGGVYGNNIDGNQNIEQSNTKRVQYIKKSIIRKYSNAIKFRLQNGDITDAERRDFFEKVVEYCEYKYPLSKKEIEAANKITNSGNQKNIPQNPFKFDDIFDFETASGMIQTIRTSSDNTELAEAEAFQIKAIEAYENLDTFAQSLSELVQCSQIDTKKFGNNVASQINFKNKIESMMTESSVWTINQDGFVESVPIRKDEKQVKSEDVSYMALKHYFTTTYLDKKFRSAQAYTKVLLQHQSFTGTDMYEEVFKSICSVLKGTTEYEAIDGKKYNIYGKIYKDETVQAIASVIDDMMRYSTFMRCGKRILPDVQKRNEDAIDFTDRNVPQTMRRLIFGEDKEKSIFERLTVLIRKIKDDPDSYDDLVDSEGQISNKFLLFLNPQLPSKKFPIGRMLLTQPQMMLSGPVKMQLQFGFDQLLRSDNEEVRQLANDLAYYAYFSTYDQNTPNAFFDLVPPSFRKQYDLALKQTLSNHRKLSTYSDVTGQTYDTNIDPAEAKRTMVIRFVNEVIDIMSRNYWFNDNIVPRFFPVVKGSNDFSMKYGSVLANAIYDAESGRSFSPWIATTERNSLYFKIRKGPTTVLYRKVGAVTKTETYVDKKGKTQHSATPFNVYAVAQKAGVHKGKINQFEFYCDKNTPSIFGENRIPNQAFAFDKIYKSIEEKVNKYKAPEGKNIEIKFEWGKDITVDDAMYQSANTDVYEKVRTLSIGETPEQHVSYAVVKQSSGSSFKATMDNSDFVVNLVNKVFANEKDNRIGVPAILNHQGDIFDHSLSNSTEKLVQAIVATGNEAVSIGIVNNYSKDEGYQIPQKRIDERKKQLVEQFKIEYNGDENVDIAAQAYEKSINEYDVKESILEDDVYDFLSDLVTNLTAKGITIKQINVPVAGNRAYARAATRIHKDFYNVFEEKAGIYPSNTFANKTSVYRNFVSSLSEICEDEIAAEDQTDVAEDIKEIVEDVLDKEEKAATKAKNKFGANMAKEADLEVQKETPTETENQQFEPEQKPKKKNKFGANMAQEDEFSISEEVKNNKKNTHENC